MAAAQDEPKEVTEAEARLAALMPVLLGMGEVVRRLGDWIIEHGPEILAQLEKWEDEAGDTDEQ